MLQRCSDNTLYNSCSATKPLFCSNGNLTNNCTACSCPSGQGCQPGGNCQLLACTDGTSYGNCSATKPKLCDNGSLVESCSSCGCPVNYACLQNGSCQLQTCSDGTLYGQCSATKPKLCDNGNLVNNCATCGCDADYECQPGGNCQLRTCADGTAYGDCSATKPLFCSNGVLINKCSACSCPSGQQCEADETCQMQSITLQPGSEGKDAYVNTRSASGNYGSTTSSYIGQYPPSSGQGLIIYRTYIEFGLSQIPANAKIVSAELQLYMENDAWGGVLDAEAYQITSAWTESQITWNNQPSAGSAIITNVVIDPGAGRNKWISWNITSLVNGWYNGTIQNYGIKLQGASEGGTQGNWFKFSSSDFSDSSQRPKLVIQYVPV